MLQRPLFRIVMLPSTGSLKTLEPVPPIRWAGLTACSSIARFDVRRERRPAWFGSNGSFLNQGDTYRSTLNARLPRGIDGSYRFIVVADANNNVAEGAFESDNTTVSSVMTVTLTPPPDLRVTAVTRPRQRFLGTDHSSWLDGCEQWNRPNHRHLMA